METTLKIESLHQIEDENVKCSHPRSPEFEFWMARNPSIPQPNLLSADQLFSQGVILPLDTANLLPPLPESITNVESFGPELTAASVLSEPIATVSRRWTDIFVKSVTTTELKVETLMTGKMKREKRSGGHGNVAELNIINIWPFSRSRSAKTSSTRPKVTLSGRKVSSAPCSRSNSGSESSSKSTKWPASPARGVHVGRSSPVWQPRRGKSAALSRLSVSDRDNVETGGGRKEKSFKGCENEMDATRSGDCKTRSGIVNRLIFGSFFRRKIY